MKIERSIEALLSGELFSVAHRFRSMEQESFASQLSFLRLDPRRDLRHSDLAYVDFSNSDLRGFDFTGADLRGVTGVNVQWDNTTKLDGADIADSLFAFSVSRDRFFEEHPEHADNVARLASDYWANTIVKVADLLENSKDKEAALHIARSVFENTRDPTVRSDILQHMAVATESKQDHKTFIYHLISKARLEDANIKFADSVLRPALTALRYNYMGDLDAFNVMKKFIAHQDPQLQIQALSGVLTSPHFFSAFDDIRNTIVKSGNPLMRRALVGRVAWRELKQCAGLLEDNQASNFIDFNERIEAEKLKAMSRRSFNRVTRAEAEDLRARIRLGFARTSSTEELERANMIRDILSFLKDKYKVPFEIPAGPIN